MSILLNTLGYIVSLAGLMLFCCWLISIPWATLMISKWAVDLLGVAPRNEPAQHTLILMSMVIYVFTSIILMILALSVLGLFIGVIG